MAIDEKWTGETPSGVDLNAVRLIAILHMSNEAELARDPFVRRIRLNEMQEAIQAIKPDIEALAEGLIFGGGDG